MKHYIYEIEGVKIGCTKDISNRKSLYKQRNKLYDLKIIDILTNETDKYAGEYERFLQKKYDYKIDRNPYHNSTKTLHVNCKIGNAKANEIHKKNKTSVYSFEIQSMGGKMAAEIQRSKGTGFFNKENHPSKLAVEINRKNGTSLFDSKIREMGLIAQKKNGLGMWAKIKCKYCEYIGNALTIAHYHNEKCKKKPSDDVYEEEQKLYTEPEPEHIEETLH